MPWEQPENYSKNKMTKISTSNIAKALYASLKDKSGSELDQAVKNAVEFLAKKNLIGKAPEILKKIAKIQNTDLNIVSAKIISKDLLQTQATDDIKSALKKRYKVDDVVLDFKEDKTLIGGIRIEAKDEVIDLSLKNKLNKLQNYLLKQ